MNILLVDDNKNNRMVLRLMLDEYSDKTGHVFTITEAEDGKIAVDLAKGEHYDIVFMDIMMPNMDGLTATKLIHRSDKTTMIIAVSAVEDDERKKVILSNGAEDYLAKPLNGDVFSTRIKNYINLVESRNSRTLQQKEPHNLFTNEIKSYVIHFYGDNEDQISEFWEYYLQDEAEYEGLSDVIRLVYSVGMEVLEQKGMISIYEEQNDKHLYITLKSNIPLDKEWVRRQVDKNAFSGNYKIEDTVLSTELEKKIVKQNAPTTAFVDSSPVVPSSSAPVPEKATPAAKTAAPVKNQIFDFLDPEDYTDLQEFINRLNSILLIVGSSDLEEYEVDEMVVALMSIAKTITSYTELYKVSGAMAGLHKDISEHRESFMAKSVDLGPLAKAFGSDLSRWFDSLFITGAPSINFLDDSIISNAKMISAFIVAEDSSSNDDVDDLFF